MEARLSKKARNSISSCLASETSLGREVYEHNNECLAIEVLGKDWSSEVLALFLEDWELGRVALSSQTNMDLFCQKMRDVCWDSSDSLGSTHVLCSQCQSGSLSEK